jgi:predicted RNA-binding Zn-ribbon protein involved in translation (DUF1610 family)
VAALFAVRGGARVASLPAMAKQPLPDTAEVELICRSCGYHMARTVARLRRDTKVVCPNCGADIVGDQTDDGASDDPR